MCRFLAYRGEPIFLTDLVCAPSHSLVHQSLHAAEAKTETNGDGFGIGWYGERPVPGTYREVRPAWSDENLRSLCDQVRSGLFFAHVRASTGTATTRANCHPFAHGRHLFMHNGQIGGYARIKRRLEALIPDDLYDTRHGTTDSEAIFLLAIANGLGEDPVDAMARTLKQVRALMVEAGDRRGAEIHRRGDRRRKPLGLSLVLRRQPADALFPRGRRQSSGGLRAHRRQDERLARGAQGLQPGGARRDAKRASSASTRPWRNWPRKIRRDQPSSSG